MTGSWRRRGDALSAKVVQKAAARCLCIILSENQRSGEVSHVVHGVRGSGTIHDS